MTLGFDYYTGRLPLSVAVPVITTDTHSWPEAPSMYLTVRLNPIPEKQLTVTFYSMSFSGSV